MGKEGGTGQRTDGSDTETRVRGGDCPCLVLPSCVAVVGLLRLTTALALTLDWLSCPACALPSTSVAAWGSLALPPLSLPACLTSPRPSTSPQMLDRRKALRHGSSLHTIRSSHVVGQTFTSSLTHLQRLYFC